MCLSWIWNWNPGEEEEERKEESLVELGSEKWTIWIIIYWWEQVCVVWYAGVGLGSVRRMNSRKSGVFLSGMQMSDMT